MFTPQVEAYLDDIHIPLRLACVTPTGWPVVLSLWYLYRNGRLYCATQRTAKVISYLTAKARCAFEVAADEPPYCGVRGQGNVTIDDTLGAALLEELLIRYFGTTDSQLAAKLLAQKSDEVAIVIEPVQVFTWNFSQRMKDAVDTPRSKPCPP